MNAPDKMITVEDALAASHTLLTVREIMRETGHAEAVVQAELTRLAKAGQIEHIPSRGLTPARYGLLRPIEKAPETIDYQDNDDGAIPANSDSEGGETDAAPDFARDPELQYLAPEDYEMPPADPALLALANRELSNQLEAARSEHMEAEGDLYEIRAALLPFWPTVVLADPTDIALAQHVAAELANARALAEKLECLLGSERTTTAALREQIERMTRSEDRAGLDASLIDSFAVIAPKRPMRRFTGHDAAVKSAMSAASNGSKRGEVFALVHVGSARRGAVWRPAK